MATSEFTVPIEIRQHNALTTARCERDIVSSRQPKGCSCQSSTFFGTTPVPQQLLIPFEREGDEAQVQLARKHLEALSIAEPALGPSILPPATRVYALFGFRYQLKPEKIKATRHPGERFLKRQG